MKTLRRPKKPAPTAAVTPPPSTATDWDLWMEKHAGELQADKPRARPARRPKKRPR